MLLSFEKNKWNIIPTPFNDHIVTAVTDNNNIYLITRKRGIVKYDGKKFAFLSEPGKYETLKNVKIINGLLYAITIDNKIIKYSGTSVVEIHNDEIEKCFIARSGKKFGFIERNIPFKGKLLHISFPENYNVFTPPQGSENVFILNNKTFLLFSNDGVIYANEHSKSDYFDDLSAVYKINGLPSSFNIGAEFFDANNDGVTDLLVLSKYYGNYLSLYRGVGKSAFANITSISNLPFKDFQILHLTISDVNKDFKKDVIIEGRVDSLHKILVYQNLGNFKFKKVEEIILPADLQKMGIRNLSTFDYDSDGDDDIIVTSYYTNSDSPGCLLIYKNNYWGNFNEIDSSLKIFRGKWNEKIIFADINNDDFPDIFNATSWSKDRLLFASDTGYIDETKTHFPFQTNTETSDVRLFDVDNDGDLDIVIAGRTEFIKIYLNDGKGYFSDVTRKMFAGFFSSYSNIVVRKASFNIGDFNNDSYTDIFVSIFSNNKTFTLLFFNDKGKKFIASPNFAGADDDFISFSSISDFDNDGDPDIFASTAKGNLLLVNRTDNNNFIKLKLNGIISPTTPLGSKIWIYKAGESGNNKFLLGYKELGSDAFGNKAANDLTLHFGLGKNKKCDIKIKFPSGKVLTLTNVSAGQTLTINETPLVYAFVYRLPGNIFRFLANPLNRLYMILIVISHLILAGGLWYGFLKLNWSKISIITFSLLNVSLFWISMYFASLSENTYVKFLTPLGVITFAAVMPLLLFTLFNRSNKKNTFVYNNKLLELMMAFSHGEWALRNLNSIILLCENPPPNWSLNEKFVSKLGDRLRTFKEMTVHSINEIVNYEKLLGGKNEELKNLQLTSTNILEMLKSFPEKSNIVNLQSLSSGFLSLRRNIKGLRNIVFSRFTARPIEVINHLISNYRNVFVNNSIKIEKKKRYPDDIPVLIRNYELGNILDNLLQNSLRFMKDSQRKVISIELYKESPKIILQFSNTGAPIPEEKWEKIFRQGFSESKSTGQGLFAAREILNKYGGRIFVSNSNEVRTTFKIELNEGIILNKG